MFGSWFYHKRVRTAVSVFGSLFNNLYVLRQNAQGETISQVKVPLSYAPKRSFIERLNEMRNGETTLSGISSMNINQFWRNNWCIPK